MSPSRGLHVERISLSDATASDRYFAFRTGYFADTLGWKVRNAGGTDRNELDDVSLHFALCDGDRIFGCIRLSPATRHAWMIDQQPFAGIIDPSLDPHYPRALTAEVSRFGVDPRVTRQRDEHGFTMGQVLRKAAYQESLRLGVRYWYVVAYCSLLAALQRLDHLPLQVIGPPASFDSRSPTCVAALDLAEAHREIALQSPEFLHWNNLGLSVSHLAVLKRRTADQPA
jgi:N-acyl-L-homoserine lactone synthetase